MAGLDQLHGQFDASGPAADDNQVQARRGVVNLAQVHLHHGL